MPADLVKESDTELIIQITIPKADNFMECENQIREQLNQAGTLATGKCLEDFDADGSPILIGNQKLTAKRTKVDKKYETPYGITKVERYGYQSSQGGSVHIPMEVNARIIGGSTPLFAKGVSYLYSHNNAGVTQASLEHTTGRKVSRCYIQDVSAAVSQQVEAKSRYIDYFQSEPSAEEVAYITIGLDGTCMLFCDRNYRQAMVGNIAFYDAEGERLHTTYIAAAPEHGKATFLRRMDEEILRVRGKYPLARYVGISDGATDYLPWLRMHTTTRILDFWHVSEYLSEAAGALYRAQSKREQWLEDTCHHLKHHHGAAQSILDELDQTARESKLTAAMRQKLDAARTYIGNNLGRMNYASYRKSKLPIGSGVTEAACKTVVKSRMCGSGMKWSQSGSDVVLTLRALSLTQSRWDEFWQNLAKNGLSVT